MNIGLKKIDAVAMKEQYAESLETYKSFLVSNFENIIVPPQMAQNKDFGSDFLGHLITKVNYSNCRFNLSVFEGAEARYSAFKDCRFFDCNFRDSDFQYCYFEEGKLMNEVPNAGVDSCNFSFSKFLETEINSVSFSGTSFHHMEFDKCPISNCTFSNSSFFQTNLKNCTLSNIDFSGITVRYCDFNNCNFENVSFHILDIANNFNLLISLMNRPANVRVRLGKHGLTDVPTAFKDLQKLIPYYFNTNQHFPLINIYMCLEEYLNVWDLLPQAFEYAANQNDFVLLKNLSLLIANLKVFTPAQLKEVYDKIRALIKPSELPYHLLKSYLTYIENIRTILLDNPDNLPVAQINIKTNISHLDTEQLLPIIKAIEENIYEVIEDASPRIELSHHSPYDIVVIICAALPELKMICETFYYIVSGAKIIGDMTNVNNGSHKEAVSLCESIPAKSKKVEKHKDINVSIEGKLGKISFKYEKEFKKSVESVDYTIV